MAQIGCEKCGISVEVTEEQAGWMPMCRKCFAISKQAENKSKSTASNPYKDQKSMGEFKPSEVKPITVEEDVAHIVKIAKQLSYDLGKDVKELNDAEGRWVSTIFIQRSKVRF